MPSDFSKEVSSFGEEKISDEDLTGDGRGDDPHVTVLYGLHSYDPTEAEEILETLSPLKIELGLISSFSDNPDFDVIKIDITGKDLFKANELLKELPYTSKYEYHPHMTLAYVKKGHCKELIGSSHFKGKKITLDRVDYSCKDDVHTEIVLSGR